MSIGATTAYNYTAITATTQIKASDGILGGIFVSTTSSGTITVYDNATTAANPIVATFTPTAPGWYPLPFGFSNGLRVVIANTLSCTVAWL